MGLRVLAPTGSGKSTAARTYKRLVEKQRPPSEQKIPILYLPLSSATTSRRLMVQILQALQDPMAEKGTEQALQVRAVAFMRRLGVELLIIDEVQHLNFRSSAKNDVTDALKSFLDAGVAPIAFLGTDEALSLFERNLQLNGRLIAPFDMPKLETARLEDRSLFASFVSALCREMEAKLIFPEPIALVKARGQDVPSRSKHPSYPHKWLLGARAMLDASEIQALVQGELGRDVLVTFWASLKTRTATFKPQLNRALREFVGGAPHLANGCWVNVTKAANMLQIERSQVRQLIELGQLDSYPGEQIPDAKRRRDFISVESIEAIRRNRSSPSTFSAYYKIPKAVISELIELGRLSTLEHPTYDLLYKEPQLNAAVAQEFFDRASDALTATRRSLTAADIRSRVPVAWLLGRDRKDVLWAHLLCALVDGTIPGGLVNIAPSRFSFEGFTFHPDDATAVLEGNLKLVPRSAPPPPYARLEEVESELDIYPRDVQKLIGSGLLVRHEQGITRDSLSNCAAVVVSTRELAGRTGFPTAELTTEAAARGVRRLWSGFGLWDRKIATTAFGLTSAATSDAA